MICWKSLDPEALAHRAIRGFVIRFAYAAASEIVSMNEPGVIDRDYSCELRIEVQSHGTDGAGEFR